MVIEIDIPDKYYVRVEELRNIKRNIDSDESHGYISYNTWIFLDNLLDKIIKELE